MPYIKEGRRNEIDENGIHSVDGAGELNYFITTSILNYLWDRTDDPSYEDHNEVIGVLECCKLEIYRRLISRYEDQKIKENGDIFD